MEAMPPSYGLYSRKVNLKNSGPPQKLHSAGVHPVTHVRLTEPLRQLYNSRGCLPRRVAEFEARSAKIFAVFRRVAAQAHPLQTEIAS